jgi:hypothetical protein
MVYECFATNGNTFEKYLLKEDTEIAFFLESSCFNVFERIYNGTVSSHKTNCHVPLN